MHGKLSKLVITGLLAAMTIIIGLTFPRIEFYPFSATFGLHVPIMIAMYISPGAAAGVALCSAIGFLSKPAIAARAFTHVIFALLGAVMLKGMPDKYPLNIRSAGALKLLLIIFITSIVHALCEALILIPFLAGQPMEKLLFTAFVVTGLGTVIHHFIDYSLTLLLVYPLKNVIAGFSKTG